MSWITIVAMVMFSMSMVLAFEKKGKNLAEGFVAVDFCHISGLALYLPV